MWLDSKYVFILLLFLKALLDHNMVTYTNSRYTFGCFFTTHIYNSQWNSVSVSESHNYVYETASSVLLSPINNLCQLYNVWTKCVYLQVLLNSVCLYWAFNILSKYSIAQNFDGGNFDVYDVFQWDCQNFTRPIFKALQCL